MEAPSGVFLPNYLVGVQLPHQPLYVPLSTIDRDVYVDTYQMNAIAGRILGPVKGIIVQTCLTGPRLG